MARLLERLGRFGYTHRLLVVLIWVLALGAAGTGAALLPHQTTSKVTIPGTESQAALDRLARTFPEADVDGGLARVVYRTPPGTTVKDPQVARALAANAAALRDDPQVAEVVPPSVSHAVSPDGRVAITQVRFSVTAPEVKPASLHAMERTAHQLQPKGFDVASGGDVYLETPTIGGTELLGVAVAAVVLALTFASLLAAGMTLLNAVIGIGFGMAGIFLVSSLTELSSTTPLLALMLGLAVGIDYSLFIVSRFRRELAAGRRGVEAAGRAVGTAGSAVVFAGLTVVIALAALSVVGIPIFTQMGLGASATVLTAVLIAVTLLPAILGFSGSRLTPRPTARHARRGRQPLGERWGRWVTRRPWAVALAAVVVLATAALPVLDMQLGLPDDGSAPAGSTQRVAYDRISETFGPGMNGPLTVVVSGDPGQAPAEAKTVLATVAELADVRAAQVSGVNDDASVALLTVLPESGPSEPATEHLVTSIRDHAPAWQDELGATVQVTGQTALNVDITDRMTAALPTYLAVVVGLALVLLMVVFRSLLVPVKAVVGFLLSACVSFGAVVAIFQWGWVAGLLGVTPSDTVMVMLPILLIGVLFGLAMDYEVFLVSGMREEHAHGASPRDSVVAGMSGGARVVSAAAVIMTSVFAAFVTVDDATIKPIAVALTVGVLVDAFVVRMTLVPAVMALLGRAAWWFPSWLDRVVPHLDIEGASLETGHHTAAAAEPPQRVPAVAGLRQSADVR